MLTTTVAVILSMTLMNIFQPWVGVEFKSLSELNSAPLEGITFSGFLLSLIPDNIFDAFITLNAMQIVTCGITLGIALLAYGKKKEVLQVKTIIETLNWGILSFIKFVIMLTPLWVFAIVSGVVAENGVESIIKLLPLVLITLVALGIHAFVSLPLIGYLLAGFHPYEYFWKVKRAILVGFSTSSSSATMWVSMQVAKEEAELNDEVINFTFPIGTTINMDGTALYQAGVAIFVSQIVGIDLSILEQCTIVLMIIMASVGAAGIPGAGIIILTTVFISIWLPIEAIGIVLAVDRILDMFRTGVNVWWDLLTAKVVDTFYKNSIWEKKYEEKLKFKIVKKKVS